MKITSDRLLASLRLLLIGTLATAGGCAAYAVPGHGANLAAMGVTPAQKYAQTDSPDINVALEKKPLARTNMV